VCGYSKGHSGPPTRDAGHGNNQDPSKHTATIPAPPPRVPPPNPPLGRLETFIDDLARYARPWQLTWGATPEEVSRSMPGDDLVPRPTFNATRAITIAAPPERIGPWLVQIGLTRAGWYSYDILDNLGRPSARRIIPELQHLAVGDIVPMGPDGKHGMPVHSIDAPRSMIWGTPGDTTWTWQLHPCPDGSTRLITRVRSRYRLLILPRGAPSHAADLCGLVTAM
jgi:hypothetical protein